MLRGLFNRRILFEPCSAPRIASGRADLADERTSCPIRKRSPISGKLECMRKTRIACENPPENSRFSNTSSAPRHAYSLPSYGADTIQFLCGFTFSWCMSHPCNKISESVRPECRRCFARPLAEFEGPGRKMWLTGATRLLSILLVMCCAA